MTGTADLSTSWSRICANESLLSFKELEREQIEIKVQELSAPQSGVPSVQGYHTGETAETLEMFLNDV